MSEPIVLTEDLLIKPGKDISQLQFLSELDSKSAIFLFAQSNLMKSQNTTAIEYYLEIIAKKLNQISHKHFEVNMIDFYINTFCTSTTQLFSSSLYNTPKCKKLISRIQVLLTYIFLYEEMVTFFDIENDHYLFAWEKEYALNYLEELNDSMNLSYSLIYRDLKEFESTLFNYKAEENIITYLLQQFENDQSDIRPIMILLDSFKWMNGKIISSQSPIQLIQDILKNNNNPKPMITYFINIMERIISDGKKDFPENIDDEVDVLINNILNKDYFQFLLDFIKDPNNNNENKFSLAYIIYSKLARDYLKVYQDTENLKGIVSILIEYIEYASCCKSFNLNGLHIFIKNNYDILGEPHKVVETKIQDVIKSENLLEPKLYGYFDLAFRSMGQYIRDIFRLFPFISSENVVESSLSAISKCIKYLSPENSLFILSNYSYFFGIYSVFPTLNCAVFYIESVCEFMHNCDDKSLCKFCESIFVKIAERLVDSSIPLEEDFVIPIFKLFEHPNFPVMIFLTDKNLYIEIISRLIINTEPYFIEIAEHLIQAIYKSRNSNDTITTIYQNILQFIHSQTIDISNMLCMTHLFSLIPKDIINSSNDAQEILKNFLSTDQTEICKSKYYIQTIIQILGFESFDKVQLHATIMPSPETILLIAKLPSDQINPTQEDEIRRAVGFAEIILNFLAHYHDVTPDLLETLINQSIHFIMPIFPFIGEVNALNFINLVVGAISKFTLKPAELRIFFSFFETCGIEDYQSITWSIFSDLKAIFLNGKVDFYLCDFDDQALEILKFQHFMFSVDNGTANGIFSQITPKNNDFSKFQKFMNDNCKKPYNDTIFRHFLSILKKRCTSLAYM